MVDKNDVLLYPPTLSRINEVEASLSHRRPSSFILARKHWNGEVS
jgi:hypothetical protein